MQHLSQKLKEFYVSLLQGGRSLGWSDTVNFEVALNSLIKSLSLFYYQPWNRIIEEPFSSMNKTEKCQVFFEKWLHSFRDSKDENTTQIDGKSLYYLSSLSSQEEELLLSLPKDDWKQFINILLKYQFRLDENFENPENQLEIITPEFLSFFAEMVINEFEKDFSVTPKVSSRKTKGVYYSPWKIIRELTDTLISHDQAQVTVLDPSCGTGSFLLYAAERIFQNQHNSVKYQLVKPSTIIKTFIYGIDKSGPAILVTKLRLLFWLIIKIPESELEIESELFSNIQEGNSLFGFVNEKFNPTIDLINSFSQQIRDSGVEGSELEQLTSILYENWIQAFSEFRSILTKRKIADILDRIYIQFLSSCPKKSKNVKSLDTLDTGQLNMFHWGLNFPQIVLEGGFDICLGNPPYGRSVLTVNEKNILKRYYLSCEGSNPKKISLNAAGAFIERSINLLKPGGRLAFILPFSVLRVEEFEGIRDYILENTVIDEIHDESAAFQEVTLEMCSLVLTKQQKHEYTIAIKPRKGLKSAFQVKKSVFKDYKRFMIYHDSHWEKIANTGKFSQIMGDYGVDHRIVKKDLLREYSPEKGYTVPFLHSGKCVTRYALNPKFFHWSKPNHPNPRFNEYLKTPKLVCTAIGNEFRIAYKPKGMIPGTNVSVMEITNPQHDFFPLMILLNSSLMNYVLKRYILNYSNLTVYLHKYYTKLIPIKYPWSNEKEWKILGEYISFLTQLGIIKNDQSYSHELKLLRRVTEYLVYQLYLPEFIEDIKYDIYHVLKESLEEINYEENIAILLSPTSNNEEIIRKNNSKLLKTESIVLSVLEVIKTEHLLDFLDQSEKKRQESKLTKKIHSDVMPKMIQT